MILVFILEAKEVYDFIFSWILYSLLMVTLIYATFISELCFINIQTLLVEVSLFILFNSIYEVLFFDCEYLKCEV